MRALFGAFFVIPAWFGAAQAADFRERWPTPYGAESQSRGTIVEVEPPPRYFPRAEEDSTPRRYRAAPRRVACIPRSVPIPTDAPDDPSYVGSTYGLGKPSYYGIKPALGVDDPFGRSLLPYCN
ncbi:hypothetical protein [Methylobacterium marchantiae]|nr:hypothetical protein AIGOOFII_0499 [Methylobacterium marchantiae]